MTTKQTRLHHLDAMRSVLMMLGIVLHTSQIYNPDRTWLIWSEDSTLVAKYLVDAIFSFRMPAFFAVSGFFCIMTLRKYGSMQFAKVRIKRIVIPLVAAAVVLTSLESVILNLTGWKAFDAISYFTHAGWLSHLWFLTVLLVYFCIATIMYALLKNPIATIGGMFAKLLRQIPMLAFLLVAPLTAVFVIASNSIGFPLYSIFGFGLINVSFISLYAPYFLFGALLFSHQDLLLRFSTVNYLSLAGLVVTAILLLHLLDSALPDTLQTIADTYLNSLVSWTMVAVVFRVFRDLCSEASSWGAFLSDASYSVYLFHHVIVISLGLVLIRFSLPPLVGMAIIITLTSVLTISIHKYIILRFKPMRYLFNGK